MLLRFASIVFIAFFCLSCVKKKDDNLTESTPIINFSVVKTFPHDTSLFTEGLVVHDGQVFESTGSPDDLPATRSLVGILNLETGQLEEKIELDRKKYFGEGITFLNQKLYQLTYVNKTGFIYDSKTFKRIGDFTFKSKEGWGLTTDGHFLIMSDGTSRLTFIDPATYQEVKSMEVSDHAGGVTQLNELEFIDGYIYANIYTTNKIICIDPANGTVVGELDLTSLAQAAKAKYDRALEMNGIAYDSVRNTVFVTGKFWPVMYQLKLLLPRNQ